MVPRGSDVTRKQKEIAAKFEAFTDSDLQHKREALTRVIPELQEELYVLNQMLKQRRIQAMQAAKQK